MHQDGGSRADARHYRKAAVNFGLWIRVCYPMNPTAQRAMLQDKVALVTGANTGIGRTTAQELARRGARVFLACRSQTRTQPVIDAIRSESPRTLVEWLPLELDDFDSVRECAARFLSRNLPLHLLVNNAGLAGQRGFTRSGFELAFGVNHMGHFLLTRLLQERLVQSAPARIVTVSSRAHLLARHIEWDALLRPTRSLFGVKEYAVSKLANVLFSAELGRRLAQSGVSTYALHPGVVDSEIWRALPSPLRMLNRMRLISTQQGALTTLYCATSAPAEETGLYYADCRVRPPSPLAQDAMLGELLWQQSERWLRERGVG